MCDTCVGYGLWAMGDPVPMYPLDASDGMPTQECPECGANPNPMGEVKEYTPVSDDEFYNKIQQIIDALIEQGELQKFYKSTDKEQE